MLSRTQKRYQVLPNLLVLLTLSLTACGGAQEKEKQVSIDGGAVGYPLHQAVAEEFKKVKADAQISVASSGTGGGMSKFCSAQIDIAGASRSIRKEEVEACRKKGIAFVELPIALDDIAVIANHNNKFVTCLFSLRKQDRISKMQNQVSQLQNIFNW